MIDPRTITNFLRYAEKLKTELRRASKSDGSRESVADHCWSLSLLLILVAPGLSIEIDLLRALKIAVIHDLVEIEAKDVSVLHTIADAKRAQIKLEDEGAAMESIHTMLGSAGEEIHELWVDFETLSSVESKVVRALDRIEGQLQFLSDGVERFKAEEQPFIEDLIRGTEELSAVDPLIAELYQELVPEIRERVKLGL